MDKAVIMYALNGMLLSNNKNENLPPCKGMDAVEGHHAKIKKFERERHISGYLTCWISINNKKLQMNKPLVWDLSIEIEQKGMGDTKDRGSGEEL